MSTNVLIEGRAAALRIENLDTDQIMPKQFLRGIGRPRPNFVLNHADYASASILVGGSNFGCGSSREHAVWGLQQFGIRAIIAPSYAEIFHSNAMNNRLLLVTLSPAEICCLMDEAEDPSRNEFTIDVTAQTVRSRGVQASFAMLPRHRCMFLDGLDSIGLSLSYQAQIDDFAQAHWRRSPWLRDVARTTRERLDRG